MYAGRHPANHSSSCRRNSHVTSGRYRLRPCQVLGLKNQRSLAYWNKSRLYINAGSE